MNPPRSERILYFIFFLSGASGLVYEVIWVRLTGLVFGNTAHAIATVLGAFMAGLALGSWRLGRHADRVANPLRTYGLLEIGIGISAALVPSAFHSLDSVYWAITPSVAAVPAGPAIVRFITSFIVLLIPTFLMGGTLPMLTRFFTERLADVERKVAVLYALNTFGAALGTILAALYFVPTLGNKATSVIIAAINIAIGAFAIWLSKRMAPAQYTPDDAAVSEVAEPAGETPQPVNPMTARLVLLTLAVSGFVSMNYEVAWTRALAALMGSSTYAFSIMLVTFLVGIALGSTIVSRWRPPASLRLLGLMQLGVAVGGLIFLIGYMVAPYVLLALVRALFYSFPAILTVQFIMSGLLMILATLFMGATFPIASQLYSRHIQVLGRTVGSIYSVNTLGAILGSLISGFVLLPAIGTERTVLLGLFFSSALSALLLSEQSSVKAPGAARACALVLLVVATLAMRGEIFWRPEMMDRGVLIYAHQFDVRRELTVAEHYEDTDVVYFKEGNNATISVRKGENYVGLRTNGKVDASNRDDMMTQLSVAYLAGFHHPAPANALIIGYGSGVTVGAATTIPELQDIDCIEIEPAVVQAGPHFAAVNRKSYENPKVHLIFDDARSYMNVTRKQYDLIISEPSNPWIAGVASLFTAEFYDRAAEVLKPDGVFVQWVQLYELDPQDLRMILSEFQRKFPEVSAWNTGIGDLILIGTRQPQRLDLGRVSRLVQGDPTVMSDFRQYLRLRAPEAIAAYYVMATEEVKKLAANAARNTDDRPLLEFHAPRQLFEDTRDLNVELLYQHKQGLIPPGADVPDPETTYGAIIEPLLNIKRSGLANQAMAMLSQVERRDPASLHIAMARLNLDSGNLSFAEDSLKKASESQQPGSSSFAETEELWGLVLEAGGNRGEAIEHFKNAALADPTRTVSLRKLADLHSQNKSWIEAAAWMEKYIATNPRGIGESWALLGDYRMAASQSAPAMEALETSIRLDPYTYWARWRLARMFEDRKQVDSAIEQYEFLVRYAFDRDPEVYQRLVQLYRDSGRVNDARRVLRKARRMFSTNPDIYRLYQDVVD
jgi:spermidine synthase